MQSTRRCVGVDLKGNRVVSALLNGGHVPTLFGRRYRSCRVAIVLDQSPAALALQWRRCATGIQIRAPLGELPDKACRCLAPIVVSALPFQVSQGFRGL